MCIQFDRVYKWKTKTESTNWGRVYSYHELIGEVYDLQIKKLRDLFDLNFVINGKVIPFHKVIKYMYVKRGSSSFDDFSAKHSLCEPLKHLIKSHSSHGKSSFWWHNQSIMFKTPRTFQIALLFYYVGP